MKLTAKLLILLMSMALIPLLVVSTLSFNSARELLTRAIQAELETKTRGELDDVEKYLDRSVGDLRTWARLRIMQDVLVDDQDGELGEELVRLHGRYRTFSSLSVVNPSGIVIASSDEKRVASSAADEAAFKTALGGVNHQGKVGAAAEGDDATLVLAEPIRADYDRDTIVGVLVGVVNWSNVQQMLAEVVIVGEQQDADRRLVLLANDTATMLYDSSAHGIRGLDPALAGLPHADGVQELELSGTSFVVGTALARGVGEFAAPGWRLHTLLAADEAYAAVHRLRERFALLGATLAVIVIAVGVFGARRVSNPPGDPRPRRGGVPGGRLQPVRGEDPGHGPRGSLRGDRHPGLGAGSVRYIGAHQPRRRAPTLGDRRRSEHRARDGGGGQGGCGQLRERGAGRAHRGRAGTRQQRDGRRQRERHQRAGR
jgi:hypothetical protein